MLIEGTHYEKTGLYDGHRVVDRILRPVEIWYPKNHVWVSYIVPENTLTDWGSIPKFADDMFGIEQRRGSVSYLTHDIHYREKLCKTRAIADMIMWSNLRYDGVPILERNINFAAVRLFGSKFYGTRRKY